MQIRITDKNDNAPYFKQELYQASVPENTDVGAVVITVTAEDEDEGMFVLWLFPICWLPDEAICLSC